MKFAITALVSLGASAALRTYVNYGRTGPPPTAYGLASYNANIGYRPSYHNYDDQDYMDEDEYYQDDYQSRTGHDDRGSNYMVDEYPIHSGDDSDDEPPPSSRQLNDMRYY